VSHAAWAKGDAVAGAGFAAVACGAKDDAFLTDRGLAAATADQGRVFRVARAVVGSLLALDRNRIGTRLQLHPTLAAKLLIVFVTRIALLTKHRILLPVTGQVLYTVFQVQVGTLLYVYAMLGIWALCGGRNHAPLVRWRGDYGRQAVRQNAEC
jgi:hypothetical protein